MVFGLKINEKLKFYQIDCLETNFNKETSYVVLIKSINPKLDK